MIRLWLSCIPWRLHGVHTAPQLPPQVKPDKAEPVIDSSEVALLRPTEALMQPSLVLAHWSVCLLEFPPCFTQTSDVARCMAEVCPSFTASFGCLVTLDNRGSLHERIPATPAQNLGLPHLEHTHHGSWSKHLIRSATAGKLKEGSYSNDEWNGNDSCAFLATYDQATDADL